MHSAGTLGSDSTSSGASNKENQIKLNTAMENSNPLNEVSPYTKSDIKHSHTHSELLSQHTDTYLPPLVKSLSTSTLSSHDSDTCISEINARGSIERIHKITSAHESQIQTPPLSPSTISALNVNVYDQVALSSAYEQIGVSTDTYYDCTCTCSSCTSCSQCDSERVNREKTWAVQEELNEEEHIYEECNFDASVADECVPSLKVFTFVRSGFLHCVFLIKRVDHFFN